MQMLFHDDFAEGLRHTGPRAPWTVRPGETSPSGDGVPLASAGGLVVEPPGADPDTGLPAFAGTSAAGPVDHLRWAAFSAPWPVPPDGVLTVAARMSARQFNTHRHPFGPAARAADVERRSGYGALVAAERGAGLVMDFALTETRAWALYVRIPAPDAGGGGFSYEIDVAARAPDEFAEYAIAVDGAEGRARWLIDGKEVFSVSPLGLPLGQDVPAHWRVDGGFAPVRAKALAAGLGLLSEEFYGQGVRLAVQSLSVYGEDGARA
ncbi:DUF6081 family protein [Actinomadura chibensis]|uniref:LamG domain-containing protein n=1 Tax=Actinomadura chibensis TaxID=392828 RepID=A0A5D0NVA2_9ACTN|nr:DUF6081 family protein [Actinomadura chibensis]TYB47991.1 hypothetical protein FXF69_01775 [Actinomadura chibensis]